MKKWWIHYGGGMVEPLIREFTWCLRINCQFTKTLVVWGLRTAPISVNTQFCSIYINELMKRSYIKIVEIRAYLLFVSLRSSTHLCFCKLLMITWFCKARKMVGIMFLVLTWFVQMSFKTCLTYEDLGNGILYWNSRFRQKWRILCGKYDAIVCTS